MSLMPSDLATFASIDPEDLQLLAMASEGQIPRPLSGFSLDEIVRAIGRFESGGQGGTFGVNPASGIPDTAAGAKSVLQSLIAQFGSIEGALFHYGPNGNAPVCTNGVNAQGQACGVGYVQAIANLLGATPGAPGESCLDRCRSAYTALLDPRYLVCSAGCGLNPSAPTAQQAAGEGPSFCDLPFVGAPLCGTIKSLGLRILVGGLAIVVIVLALNAFLGHPVEITVKSAAAKIKEVAVARTKTAKAAEKKATKERVA